MTSASLVVMVSTTLRTAGGGEGFPAPVRETVCGEPVALSATEMVAE